MIRKQDDIRVRAYQKIILVMKTKLEATPREKTWKVREINDRMQT